MHTHPGPLLGGTGQEQQDTREEAGAEGQPNLAHGPSLGHVTWLTETQCRPEPPAAGHHREA